MTASAPVPPDGISDATVCDTPHGRRLRDALLTVEPGRRRRAIMTGHLVGTVADLTGREATDVDPAVPLAGLGLTSAQIVELRTRLHTSLGIALSPTVGWQYPTLDRLGGFVAERMGVPLDAPAGDPTRGGGAPPRRPVPSSGADSGPLMSAEASQDLSDEQVAALLLARIEQMDGVIGR